MNLKTRRAKILIADDHPIVRSGLKQCLVNHDELEMVGEATHGIEAVELCEKLKPDIVLMDVNMPKLNGLEATRQLSRKNPEIKVLILTVHDKKEYVLEMIRSGAKGYLLKDASEQELVQAIQVILDGDSYFSPKIAKVLVEHHGASGTKEDKPGEKLSRKEREVLALIAKEFKNKEIADQFGISVRTVETYRERIMQKLNIHTVAGLTKFAISEGIIFLEQGS